MADKVLIADVVLVRGDRVLLVQQRNEPAVGKWSLPGGRAEPGETPLATALREIREELGIELGETFARSYLEHEGVGPNEAHLHITTFFGFAPSTDPRIKEDELMGFG